jgi:peroxiredoxin
MKSNLFLIFFVLFLFCSFTNPPKEIKISNFKLKSATTNNWVSLSDFKNAKGFVVVFISNKCPMARFYSTRLNQINDKYKSSNVFVLAINSMDTLAYANESFSKMQTKAKTEKLNFPYLQDKKQNVAKQFKAENTPQAFVIWKDKWGKFAIKYQGAIDDNAGEPEKIKNHFLTDAVDQLLQGKKVVVATSQSFGCRIFYRGIKDKMK